MTGGRASRTFEPAARKVVRGHSEVHDVRYSSRSTRRWPAGIVAAVAGSSLLPGAEAEVPYTADYDFWKKGSA